MAQLNERQAFEAMVRFLEGVYDRTQSDDIGALRGKKRETETVEQWMRRMGAARGDR